MSKVAAILVAATVVFCASEAAYATPAGDTVLAGMDAAMNRARTQQFDYEVTNKEAGKAEVTLGLKELRKGEKDLKEFTAPLDMKGTKVLVLSPTQMYVYLPAFGKVRRIASHTAEQGFMGLAFSQDDFATTSYSGDYTAAVTSETPTQWKLALTPKSGRDTKWAKIEIFVNKDRKLPAELKYFNAAGQNVKTESRTGYTCEGDVCSATEQKMTNNTTSAWTKLVRKAWKVNAEISDDVFSQRSLGE